ncbi:hypothetical protein HOP50_13g68750 [Chloropicon primus]|uniref:F-box domain-containing protein n=1 Tax=Chloropicon primus TaxID=1764295 RepID=A0A5B8MVD8_9CHLO|nr:hypothetical protein A3770_13p68550 [Chloropicon primus]UPR03545.1 hypothetical protein HOP50_13g68750 [Chloropicon primus]|eukprot:QDZ24337.1 hypothetical protein A3770_13p68550 [Chloropicon primus]
MASFGAKRRKVAHTCTPHNVLGLPDHIWEDKILAKLDKYDHLAFSSVCKAFSRIQGSAAGSRGLGVKTDLSLCSLFETPTRFTLDWFRWVFHSGLRKEGCSPGFRGTEFTPFIYDNELMHLAGFQGQQEIIEWLVHHGVPLDIDGYRVGRGAAQGGHLHVLKWLKGQGYSLARDGKISLLCIAYRGHMELLKWAKSEGCLLDQTHVCRAALGGHIDVLEWMGSEGLEGTEEARVAAAHGGNLDVLKWMRKREVSAGTHAPWDGSFCIAAAKSGRIEILKWASRSGISWDTAACYFAARLARQVSVSEWILEESNSSKDDAGSLTAAATQLNKAFVLMA